MAWPDLISVHPESGAGLLQEPVQRRFWNPRPVVLFDEPIDDPVRADRLVRFQLHRRGRELRGQAPAASAIGPGFFCSRKNPTRR